MTELELELNGYNPGAPSFSTGTHWAPSGHDSLLPLHPLCLEPTHVHAVPLTGKPFQPLLLAIHICLLVFLDPAQTMPFQETTQMMLALVLLPSHSRRQEISEVRAEAQEPDCQF